MHSYESEGMSGRRPAGKFYHDSEALDRRIILERIPTMTMEDLRILNLETYSQSHSLKQLIGELKLQESPNWDNISSMRFICFVLDKFAITSREEIRYRNKLQELEIKLANLERERLTILQRCKKNNSKHMSNHKGFYYKHVKEKTKEIIGRKAYREISQTASEMASQDLSKLNAKNESKIEKYKQHLDKKIEECKELGRQAAPEYTRVKVTRDADGNLRFE